MWRVLGKLAFRPRSGSHNLLVESWKNPHIRGRSKTCFLTSNEVCKRRSCGSGYSVRKLELKNPIAMALQVGQPLLPAASFWLDSVSSCLIGVPQRVYVLYPLMKQALCRWSGSWLQGKNETWSLSGTEEQTGHSSTQRSCRWGIILSGWISFPRPL